MQTQNNVAMTWNTETFAENPNANAIRWGTMYNFRFDSNRPPQNMNATIGFFKTGAPINVLVQGPGSGVAAIASVAGRVMSAAGKGVAGSQISITDSNGNTRIVVTNPFGYYRFANVATGGTYTIRVLSKRYTFASRTVQVNDNITGIDFVAEQ
jgi:hypothetical protein